MNCGVVKAEEISEVPSEALLAQANAVGTMAAGVGLEARETSQSRNACQNLLLRPLKNTM